MNGPPDHHSTRRASPAATHEGPGETARGKNFSATRSYSPDEDRAQLKMCDE
jgi:hypothetical protein